MNNEQLLFKALCSYLPYKVEYIFKVDDVQENAPKEKRIKLLTCDSMSLCIKYGKPLLIPLSELNKKIEYDGEMFFPIEKIAIYSNTEHGLCYLVEQINTGFIEVIVYEQLLKWHFDVFNLIPKGLAINKNEVSK